MYFVRFWNLLSSVGSHEGYHFLYDTSPWRSLLSNENAAMLGSVEPDGYVPVVIFLLRENSVFLIMLFQAAKILHQ